MEHVAKFEKVSFGQFYNDFSKIFLNKYPKEKIQEIYNNLKLPCRATVGSAGYDFFLPISISLKPNETIKIPTGIRVAIKQGWMLAMFPRSGLGFKYRLQLDNTVGIIDSDYYNALNEGHIFCKLTNNTNNDLTIELKQTEAFIQGVFLQYGIVEDDNVTDMRIGGFGSTSLK